MITKRCFFGFVVVCSLFFLTACPKPSKADEVKIEESSVEKDFASLKEAGFVPPVVRLGDSYINDKIESKEKKLSYEYHYIVVKKGQDFAGVKTSDLFGAGTIFHNATIDEADAGNASKTNLKYEKLKAVNGGEICIGTKFVLGLVIKDQVNSEIYKARINFTVFAPHAGAVSNNANTISVPGDQTAFDGDITVNDAGAIDPTKTKFENDVTTYTLKGSNAGKVASLTYGSFGDTNRVVVK